MKRNLIAFAALLISISACTSNNDKNTSEKAIVTDTTSAAVIVPPTAPGNLANDHVNDMVSQYLSIKNALANDNGKSAAAAGSAFVESMSRIDHAALLGDKKKAWDAVADDAIEMADHIGKNADNIKHQREHFDMLSKDMYDIVKAFGSRQKLYKTFCPMYNDNKGANWLSETREIKNPYFGQKMSRCGEVTEEMPLQ